MLFTRAELTPKCQLDFDVRLVILMTEAGIHHRGFSAFLVEATGFSKSGARRILVDKRPPKRNEVFLKLVHTLTTAINAKKGKVITTDEVVNYLLNEKRISALFTKTTNHAN
jgi:hypothetical protein